MSVLAVSVFVAQEREVQMLIDLNPSYHLIFSSSPYNPIRLLFTLLSVILVITMEFSVIKIQDNNFHWFGSSCNLLPLIQTFKCVNLISQIRISQKVLT